MKRREWIPGALLAAGLLLAAAGVALIYLPAGVIALGVELAALGVVSALGGEEGGRDG